MNINVSDFSAGLVATWKKRGLDSFLLNDDFFEKFEKAFKEFHDAVPEEWKPRFRIQLDSSGDSQTLRNILDHIVWVFRCGYLRGPDNIRIYLQISPKLAELFLEKFPEPVRKAFEMLPP